MARKGFTDEQRAMLRKAFEENESLAEKGRKTRLAAETGLNESQVKNWFHDHKKTKKGKTTAGNNASWMPTLPAMGLLPPQQPPVQIVEPKLHLQKRLQQQLLRKLLISIPIFDGDFCIV
uniref:Homeobox domain-containing protein n=1 Tax=Ditylenchus dipsaci TaxID=166011 RepID=A0A915EM77_9BILA